MHTLRANAALLVLLLGLPVTAAAQDTGAGSGAGAGAPAGAAREAPPAPESGETDLSRVQRDQSRIGLRVTSLRDKMERLAQRYEDEGRTRNATLLRDALKTYDDKKLADLSHDLEHSLDQGNLSTVEQQDALAKSLEDIYAVLRDRRDADELEKQADLARQGVSELSFLSQNERSLLSATRAATDQPGSLIQQALDMLKQLQQALKTTAGATQSEQSAQGAIGDAALADALAREQRALAQDNTPTAQTQALLQQALDLLRERLAKPVQAPDQANGAAQGGAALGDELIAAAQSARDEARSDADHAAQSMAAAHDQLQHAEASTPGAASAKPGAGKPSAASEPGSPTTGASTAGETSGDKSGEKSSDKSGAPSGEKPGGGTKPDTAKPDSSTPAATPSGGAASAESSAASAAAGDKSSGGKPGDQAPSETSPSGKPAAGKPGGAQQPGNEAAGAQSPQLAEARAAMDEAAQKLEAARDALDKSERSLTAAKNRAQALATATTQDAAKSAAGMEDLAQRLETVQPKQGPELLDRTRQLIEDLSKLAQSVDQGDMAGAQGSQQSAQTNLDELIKQLQARAASTPAEAPKTPDQKALDPLAQKQQELEDHARELMKRLSELPDQKFAQPGGAAVQSMGGAQKALSSGDSNEAAVREEEAAEKLDQAAQQLSGERDKYEQLQQEEVLFRLDEDLKALIDAQDALSTETKEIDGGRTDADRLGRSQSRAVGRLSSGERDLASQAERLRAALEKDGSVAFTFALERTRDDFNNAADLLGSEQTGVMTQTVQADARQRVVDLLDVLDKEMQRRRDAKAEEAPPEAAGQQDQKEPLVPTVAELLLVQRMEQAALARLENFERLNPKLAEQGDLDPVARSLIERWAAEHNKVTEMFKAMIPQHDEAIEVDKGKSGGKGQDGPAPQGGSQGGSQGGHP